ncbi:MAG: glycerophosphodiester phosphodiesterase family protein, partial [Gammaproteobacteria bacterium]
MIAHRGASGERPEHTLAAYELALVEGADFIELDLVPTADGHLIARHENALAMVELDADGVIVREASGRPRVREATTDVADRPEFADRLAVKPIDGRAVGGWFSEDFTLAEIRTLKARERMPEIRPASSQHDDRYGVPTLKDVIGFVDRWSARNHATPGLYVELKHPTYFRRLAVGVDGRDVRFDLGPLLLDALQDAGFTDRRRVFIQCFEVAPLIELKDLMGTRNLALPLIQLFGDVDNRYYRAGPEDMRFHAEHGTTAVYGRLATLIQGGIRPEVSYAELATPAVLGYMAERYAAGIGPPRANVMLTSGSTGRQTFTGEFGPLLSNALRAGLLVHPWTLRAEQPFLVSFQGRVLSVAEEAELLLEAGADGFFIDQPAEGRAA